MKKTLVSLTAGILLAGTAVTSVSAQEYEIQKGDTLGNIADNYNTTVNSLKDINNLDTDIIYPGQTISIDQEVYQVKKGDTLSGISQEFGVTVNDLKAWNGLDSDLIVIDQTLNVQGQGQVNNEAPVEAPANTDDQTADNTEEAQQDESQEPAADDQAADQEDANQEDNQDAEDQEDNQAEDDQAAANAQAADVQEDSDDQADTDNQSDDESKRNDASEGKTIQVSSTAYTGQCDGCSGTTTTGIDLDENPDKKVIAVDPDVIPLGSKVHVEGYGDAIAADTGGSINGKKIDVHVPDEDAANEWGVQDVEVTILD